MIVRGKKLQLLQLERENDKEKNVNAPTLAGLYLRNALLFLALTDNVPGSILPFHQKRCMNSAFCRNLRRKLREFVDNL